MDLAGLRTILMVLLVLCSSLSLLSVIMVRHVAGETLYCSSHCFKFPLSVAGDVSLTSNLQPADVLALPWPLFDAHCGCTCQFFPFFL